MKITRIALLMIISIHPAASRADDSELPQQVQSALQLNARAMTDLTISGIYKRQILDPAGNVLAKLGTLESEEEFTRPTEFELRLQGAKIYESVRYPINKDRSEYQLDELSFDGTKYFSGSVNPRAPNQQTLLRITGPANIQEEDRKRSEREMLFQLWYLNEAGFGGPEHAGELGRSIESLVLERSAYGRIESVKIVGQENQKLVEVVVSYPEPWASSATIPIESDESIQRFVGDSKKLQVRIERERRHLRGQKRINRYLLDSVLGYAVREKWESRATGAVLFHTTNSEFHQIEAGGVWLPHRCKVASYAYSTAPEYTSPEPLYSTEFQITKIQQSTLPDEQFRLWYGHPGDRVTDFTHASATPSRPYNYIVPASLESGLVGSKKVIWIILFNLLLAMILVLVVYSRSRNATPSKTSHTPNRST